MKQIFNLRGIFLFAITVFLFSCKKLDAIEPNEEEVITTLKLIFTPEGGGAPFTCQYDDADGPGGINPTQDIIQLQKGITYNVALEILNKTEMPVGDITAEIASEKNAHRFYFIPSQGNGITINGLDKDENDISLGLNSVWNAGANVSTGKIRITLRHFSGTPSNKLEADPVDSPKSATDIEVEFDTQVN